MLKNFDAIEKEPERSPVHGPSGPEEIGGITLFRYY